MGKKEAFLNFLEQLMNASPDIVANMSEDAKVYLQALKIGTNENKQAFTDNGKLILQYMQEHSEIQLFQAKDIANELAVSSRTVSGAIRKLVTDGYVEKMGTNPVIYSITSKGKEINID